jgi:hypothetical protein
MRSSKKPTQIFRRNKIRIDSITLEHSLKFLRHIDVERFERENFLRDFFGERSCHVGIYMPNKLCSPFSYLGSEPREKHESGKSSFISHKVDVHMKKWALCPSE